MTLFFGFVRSLYVQSVVAMVKLSLNIVANVLVRDEFALKRTSKSKFLLGSAVVVFFGLLGRVMLRQRGMSILSCTVTVHFDFYPLYVETSLLDCQRPSRRSFCLP